MQKDKASFCTYRTAAGEREWSVFFFSPFHGIIHDPSDVLNLVNVQSIVNNVFDQVGNNGGLIQHRQSF